MPLFEEDFSKIKNRRTTEVNFDNRDLKVADIKELVQALNKAPHIESLSLRDNNLDDRAAHVLSKLAHITELTLTYNNISGTNKDAVQALVSNAQIKELYFDSNTLTDAITDTICQHAQQTLLSVYQNKDLSSASESRIQKKIRENKWAKKQKNSVPLSGSPHSLHGQPHQSQQNITEQDDDDDLQPRKTAKKRK